MCICFTLGVPDPRQFRTLIIQTRYSLDSGVKASLVWKSGEGLPQGLRMLECLVYRSRSGKAGKFPRCVSGSRLKRVESFIHIVSGLWAGQERL
jgi:hypothetical protein